MDGSRRVMIILTAEMHLLMSPLHLLAALAKLAKLVKVIRLLAKLAKPMLAKLAKAMLVKLAKAKKGKASRKVLHPVKVPPTPISVNMLTARKAKILRVVRAEKETPALALSRRARALPKALRATRAVILLIGAPIGLAVLAKVPRALD